MNRQSNQAADEQKLIDYRIEIARTGNSHMSVVGIWIIALQFLVATHLLLVTEPLPPVDLLFWGLWVLTCVMAQLSVFQYHSTMERFLAQIRKVTQRRSELNQAALTLLVHSQDTTRRHVIGLFWASVFLYSMFVLVMLKNPDLRVFVAMVTAVHAGGGLLIIKLHHDVGSMKAALEDEMLLVSVIGENPVESTQPATSE